MKYYLETNALYSIDKINECCGENCFTSAFSLFELVSGLNEENYEIRKNIFRKLKHSQIGLDKKMPEEIIFDSFNALKNYEFIEDRISALNVQINGIIESNNFSDFKAFNASNNIDFSFDFFKYLDNKSNEGFVKAIENGNNRLRQVLKKEKPTIIENGKLIQLENNKDLKRIFEFQPELSREISIIAFVGFIKEKGVDLSGEKIIGTYNGLIDQYIQCISDYSDEKLIRFEASSKNDYSDLTHLLYLRNNKERVIVTNDKIFKRYFKGNVIEVDKLLKGKNRNN